MAGRFLQGLSFARVWLAGTYAYFLIINGISLRVQISFHLVFPALRTARETFTGGGGGLSSHLKLKATCKLKAKWQENMAGIHVIKHRVWRILVYGAPLWNAAKSHYPVKKVCSQNYHHLEQKLQNIIHAFFYIRMLSSLDYMNISTRINSDFGQITYDLNGTKALLAISFWNWCTQQWLKHPRKYKHPLNNCTSGC